MRQPRKNVGKGSLDGKCYIPLNTWKGYMAFIGECAFSRTSFEHQTAPSRSHLAASANSELGGALNGYGMVWSDVHGHAARAGWWWGLVDGLTGIRDDRDAG